MESNARDVYAWHVFEPVAVGDGHGDVDWDADPYEDEGWRLWLASLRWIGPSIEAAREGDEEAFAVAERLIADWAADPADAFTENRPQEPPVLRLVPSVVRKFGSRTHLQLGIMAPLVGDDTPGIKFATWITF